MRILIFASPRSGSTSLTYLIESHLKKQKYKVFFDPFNPKFYNNYKMYGEDFIDCEPFIKHNNLLVKSIIMIDYKEYPTKIFSNEDEYIDWCVNFFDKVIVLDRENKKEQSESFVINETEEKRKGLSWHTQKIYNIDRMDMNFYNNMYNILTETKKRLLDITQKNNLPYFLYEKLYTDNNQEEIKRLFDYLEIEPIDEYVSEFINNKNRRVRINPTKTINLI